MFNFNKFTLNGICSIVTFDIGASAVFPKEINLPPNYKQKLSKYNKVSEKIVDV